MKDELLNFYFCYQPLNFRTKIVRKWLSVIQGQEWKDIRSSVTPAFTTGKIKRVNQNSITNYQIYKIQIFQSDVAAD
jgi:hypothetical protein